MATTEHFYTGNNSTTSFAFTFPYLANSDVKVELDNVLKTENSSGQTNNDYTINNTNIVFNTAPGSGVSVHIYRTTNVDTAQATYAAGSSIRAVDLNNNQTQVLYSTQESAGQLIRQSDLKDSIVTSAKIVDGSIVNADVNASAAIEGSKIQSSSGSNSGTMSAANFTKLAGIETGATADQTASDIKTLIAGSPLDSSHLANDSVEVDAIKDTQLKELATMSTNAAVALADLTGNEVGILDGATVSTTELNKLDGVTATTTELNYVDGVTSNVQTQLDAKQPLDAQLTELATISGNAAEALADLTGNEVRILDGATVSTDELNYVDGVTSNVQTQLDAKQPLDSELTTLAGMQGATASKLADSTALTSDIADLNQIDGLTKQSGTNLSDTDSSFPTSAAVVNYVAAQIAPLGGLEVIATEVAFPNTQPAAGVVISISDAGGVEFNGSGVSTTGRTVGGSTVTINNAPSSLNSETLAAGVGLMVSSTGSSQTYNYHKILGKEDDIKQLSDDINDFNARYRVGSSNPTSALDAGDLFFNTSTQKLLVYNSTNSAWEEAQSVGNFYISTFSESFDGSRTAFTVSNAPTNAQQLIISINGVIQKPNSGTGQPSEGFTLSGSTVTFSSAIPSGSDYFVVVVGSTVNIGTPSDNTVTTDILQSGAVTNAKVNASAAIQGTKISPDFGSQNVVTTGTLGCGQITTTANIELSSADPVIAFTDTDNNDDFSIRGGGGLLRIRSDTDSADRLVVNSDGHIDITDHLDVGAGVDVTGNITATGTLSSGNLTVTDPDGSAKITIKAFEANNANLYITADEGDDNGDEWLIQSNAASNKLRILNDVSGSPGLKWDISTDGDVQQVGHLDLPDDKQLRIGNSDDFAIEHSSSTNLTEVTLGGNKHVKFKNATQTDNYVLIGSRGDVDPNRHMLSTVVGGVEQFHTDHNGNMFAHASINAGRTRSDADNPANNYQNGPYSVAAFSGRTDDSGSYRSRMAMTACDYLDGQSDSSILYFLDSGSDTAGVDYDADQKFSVKQNGMIEGLSSIMAGRVKSDERSNTNVVYSSNEGYVQTSYNQNLFSRLRARASDNTDDVLLIDTGGGVVIKFQSDGNGRFDGGADIGSASDYAEYFEWKDGNTSSADRRGITVVLDGEKIRPATDSDDKSKIIGVVSANPAVVGDSAWSEWQAAHKKDAYGSWVTEDKEYLIWNDFCTKCTVNDKTKITNEQPDPNDPNVAPEFQILVSDIDAEKAKGNVPQAAIDQNIRITRPSRTYNPDYDPSKDYVPRSERKEWDAIGLVGKLVVRRGQPVGTNWILMKSNVGVDPTDNSIVLDKYLVR